MLPRKVRSSLRSSLKSTSTEPYFQQIAELVRPAVCFDVREDSQPQFVTTRMGGCPDVPESWRWPVGPEGPLRFLGQVYLEELKKLPAASLLPESGVLSFFFGPHVYGPSSKTDYRIARVYHFDADNLWDAEPPADASLHPACDLIPKQHWDMPIDDDHFATEPFYRGMGEDERSSIACDLIDAGEASGAMQLLGYPSREQQGFLQLECEAYSRGYDYRTMQGKERDLKRTAQQWEVLAQFYLAWEEVWPDGNDGHIHFWIRKRDLAKCNFDNICYTWERS